MAGANVTINIEGNATSDGMNKWAEECFLPSLEEAIRRRPIKQEVPVAEPLVYVSPNYAEHVEEGEGITPMSFWQRLRWRLRRVMP